MTTVDDGSSSMVVSRVDAKMSRWCLQIMLMEALFALINAVLAILGFVNDTVAFGSVAAALCVFHILVAVTTNITMAFDPDAFLSRRAGGDVGGRIVGESITLHRHPRFSSKPPFAAMMCLSLFADALLLLVGALMSILVTASVWFYLYVAVISVCVFGCYRRSLNDSGQSGCFSTEACLMLTLSLMTFLTLIGSYQHWAQYPLSTASIVVKPDCNLLILPLNDSLAGTNTAVNTAFTVDEDQGISMFQFALVPTSICGNARVSTWWLRSRFQEFSSLPYVNNLFGIQSIFVDESTRQLTAVLNTTTRCAHYYKSKLPLELSDALWVELLCDRVGVAVWTTTKTVVRYVALTNGTESAENSTTMTTTLNAATTATPTTTPTTTEWWLEALLLVLVCGFAVGFLVDFLRSLQIALMKCKKQIQIEIEREEQTVVY